MLLARLLASFVAVGQDALPVDASWLAVFPGERGIVVEYSGARRAQLEAAIVAIKGVLGVPADLNEESEQAVGVLAAEPSQESLVAKLAECYFTLGAVFKGGSGDEAVAYRRGKHWGMKALRMDPAFAATEKKGGFLAAVKQETRVPEFC